MTAEFRRQWLRWDALRAVAGRPTWGLEPQVSRATLSNAGFTMPRRLATRLTISQRQPCPPCEEPDTDVLTEYERLAGVQDHFADQDARSLGIQTLWVDDFDEIPEMMASLED